MEWKLIWQIFWLFTRVAMFSWGGGPASLGLMQREVVSLGWLTPDEFADNIALSNVLPGPTAPKVSAYVGFKLAGWQGAFSAVAGTVVPTTLLMLILIVGFFSIRDNPYTKAAIRGVRPLVVGFLVWSAYVIALPVFGLDKQGLISSILQNWDKWLIAVITFMVLAFTNVSPFLLVLIAGIIGLIFFR
jgi:chromate transporter